MFSWLSDFARRLPLFVRVIFYLDLLLIPVIIYLTIYILRHHQEIRYAACRTFLIQISNAYLCGHHLYSMLCQKFFKRFGDFNHDGFCYTVSGIIMLALKNNHSAKYLRGFIRDRKSDFQTEHSWVEVKVIGIWWVVDPVLTWPFIVPRRHYNRLFRVERRHVYSYTEFWRHPDTETLHDRLQRPETSWIFVELYKYFTPKDQTDVVFNPQPIDAFLENHHQYLVFPPEFGFKFSQRIVDDFMAKPTRKSPKKRTLRRLYRFYRQRFPEFYSSSAPESSLSLESPA